MRYMRHEREDRGNNLLRGYLAAIILSVVFWIGYAVAKTVGPGYEFQYHVHSHIENAYFAYSPEIYIEELEKAKLGMATLGLTNDTYAAYFYWGKTPDWRMDYQYRHIDSLIMRGKEVLEWREKNTGSQFVDIYNQKMQNIRSLLISDGDWSDDIAREAFYANKHPFFYFGWVLFILNVLGLVFLTAVLLWRYGYE